MPVSMKYGKGVDEAKANRFFVPLWTNPSPTSSFAAQTISIDLNAYAWFAIETRWSTSSDLVIPLCIYKVDESRHIISLTNDASNRTGGRQFAYSITNKAITFEGGYYNGSSSNANVIPIAIYGVKL